MKGPLYLNIVLSTQLLSTYCYGEAEILEMDIKKDNWNSHLLSFISSERFYDSEEAGIDALALNYVFLFNLISTYLDYCSNCNLDKKGGFKSQKF